MKTMECFIGGIITGVVVFLILCFNKGASPEDYDRGLEDGWSRCEEAFELKDK